MERKINPETACRTTFRRPTRAGRQKKLASKKSADPDDNDDDENMDLRMASRPLSTKSKPDKSNDKVSVSLAHQELSSLLIKQKAPTTVADRKRPATRDGAEKRRPAEKSTPPTGGNADVGKAARANKCALVQYVEVDK